jgi:hypothetical protein
MTVRTRSRQRKGDNDQRETEPSVYQASSASGSDSEDGAPEAVSLTASKTKVVSQIKAEREAQRQVRERRRVRNLKLEEQNKLKKQRELNEQSLLLHGDKEEDASAESSAEPASKSTSSQHGITLAPLPMEVIEEAFAPKVPDSHSHSESELERIGEDSGPCEMYLAERHALALKRKLINALPFQVTEIGKHGVSRITREEARARVLLLQAHEARQLGSVRRISASLDRARKHRRLVRAKKL